MMEEDISPPAVQHTHLCVGGPLAGQRFASQRKNGFVTYVWDKDAASKLSARDRETVKAEMVGYRAELFCTPQGDVLFWVPQGQTPMQTICLLIAGYEKSARQIAAHDFMR